MRPIHRALAAAVTALAAASVQADIGLFEYAFNIDGTVSNITLGDPIPGGVNDAGFDDLTGLGTVSYTITGAGAHNFAMFVDHEIDEADNTFFNELGSATGAPSAGLSFEIDEPGYSIGDIYTNFEANSLDNSILAGPEDIAMALGWDFLLNAGETATITMTLSDTAPGGGFYLQQFDADSLRADPDAQANVFFSSNLRITGEDFPDTGSTLLMLLGAGGCLLGLRRRSAS